MKGLTSGEVSYIGGGRDGGPPARERRTDEDIGRHGGILARNRGGDNFHRCSGYSVSTVIRGDARELSDSSCEICRSGPFGVGHRLSAFEAGGTKPGRRAGPSCIQCRGGYVLRVGRCCDPVPGLLAMAGRRSACRDCRRIVSAVSGKEFATKLAFGMGSMSGPPFLAICIRGSTIHGTPARVTHSTLLPIPAPAFAGAPSFAVFAKGGCFRRR